MVAVQRLLAGVGSLVVLGALVSPAPSAVGAATSWTTPILPTATTSLESDGPSFGNLQGTLMADGTIRPTSDPTAVISPAPVAGESLSQRLSSGSHLATDVGVAGITVTGSSGLLWLVDLADGTNRTRDVAILPTSSVVVGATATAWVTTAQAPSRTPTARSVTFWPFDGSASYDAALPGLTTGVVAGSVGVVYATYTGTAMSVQVLDASSATESLWTGPTGSGPWDVAYLTTSGRAVAWTGAWPSPSLIAYWDAAGGVRSAEVDTPEGFTALSVAPGAVALEFEWQDGGPWTMFLVPSAATLVPVLGSPPSGLQVWTSATATGATAFQGVLSEYGDGSASYPWSVKFTSWVSWALGDTSLRTVAPGQALIGSPMRSALGSSGSLLQTYWPAPNRQTLVVRDLDSAGSALVSTTNAALNKDGGYPANTRSDDLSLSGGRSAIPEYIGTSFSTRLVLRDRGAVTGRVATPVYRVSTSGPFTAYLSSLAAVVRVVGPNGALAAATAAGTPGVDLIAQDGARTVYATQSGALRLLDTTTPTSATNPRLLPNPCGTPSAGCLHRIMLSGRWLVSDVRWSSGGHRLVVLDLVTGRVRRWAGAEYCTQMSGPVVLCGTGTVNVSARTLTLRALPGNAQATLLAGRLYGVQSRVDPLTGYPTAVTLSPIPAANGTIGPPRILGAWSQYGAVLSTRYPWRPQFSVTDPLTTWTLTMRSSSGRVVARWSGRAPDRELRGIAWNGRDLSGHQLPAGTYRWTLTGTSRYGTPVAVLGSGTPTGIVRILRQSRAYITTVATGKPTATTPAYRTVTVTARLRTARGTAVPGSLLTLWRRGSNGTWSQIDAGITSSVGAVVWRFPVSTNGVYQVRNAADPRAVSVVGTAITIRR